jgi:hypothetical protein
VPRRRHNRLEMAVCHRVYWLTIDSGYFATGRQSDAVLVGQALYDLGIPFKSDVTDEWETRPLRFSEAVEITERIGHGKDKGTKGKAAGKTAGNRKR